MAKRLEVLEGQHVRGGATLVDGKEHAADGLGLTFRHGQLAELLGLGDGPGGFGLALGIEDVALLAPLGLEDRRCLLALGPGDGRFASALGLGDHGPAGAFGLHDLVHRRHDVGWGIHALDLDPNHPYPPVVGGVVEDGAQRGVDLVARRQGLVELEIAHHIAQVGLGQLGDGEDEVPDVVDQALGVGGFVEDHGVDRGHHVVRGDDLLRRDIDHLLSHVDGGDPVDAGDDEAQSRVDGLLVLAQPLDQRPLVGPHDLDARGDEDHHDQGEDGEDDHDGGHEAPSPE